MATPEDAEAQHAFIRDMIRRKFGEDSAKNIQILYGGSVKPENIKNLMKMPNIDGALVGGASLNVDSFEKLIKFAD